MRRGFLPSIILLALVLGLCRLPATWMDALVAAASEDRIRIAAAEGSLWHGHGILASRRRDGSLEPWQPLAWRIGFGAPWRGEATLTLDDAYGVGHGRIVLSPQGWRLENFAWRLPLPLLAAAMTQGVARVGWRGEAGITATDFGGDWRGKYAGRAALTWTHASVDLVPNVVFGDYCVVLEADRGPLRIALSADDGSLLKLQGEGTSQRFDGFAEGPPDLVGQLPNIAVPYVRPGDTPERVTIRLN